MGNRKPMKHDSFFRAAMSREPVYSAFFERHLPQEIKRLVDMEQIKPCKGSFVDRSLRAHLTDVVFTAPIAGSTGYLYVLVEHQSTQERLMPFRLQKYVLEIMDDHIKKQGTKTLPLVIPMVFFNGQSRYSQPRDFFELFDVSKDLAQSIMSGPMRVIDLGDIPDEELKGHLWLSVLHLLMKHITEPDIVVVLLDLMPILQQIEHEKGGKGFILESMTYILSTGQAQDANQVIDLARQSFNKEIGEEIMTVAEMLRKEGEAKAKEEFALRLLRENMSTDFIVKVTGLPTETVEHLKQQDAVRD